MSARRLAAAALTAVLAAGPVVVTASPATAEPLPTRTVVSKVVKNKGHLVFKGRVDPGDPGKNVVIQRKKCARCSWKFYAKTQTDETVHYRQEIAVPRKGRWFYRAKVSAYGGYGPSRSGVWKVYLA
jgi:hypothetical protein